MIDTDDPVGGAIPERVVLAGVREHRRLEGKASEKASEKAASFPTISDSVPASRFLPPHPAVGSLMLDCGL